MLQRGLDHCFAVQWILPNTVILATCVMFEYHIRVKTLEDSRRRLQLLLPPGIVPGPHWPEAKHVTTNQ